MNPNEALAFLNSQASPLEAPAQKESLSPNEAGQQLAVQPRATGMSKEDALNFLTSGSSQATPRGSDASYLTSPIPAAQEITSDPNNLTSNYIQSVPQATPQATPQASQGMSKEDALAFLGGSLPEQTGKPINLPAMEQPSKAPAIEGQVEAGNIDLNNRPVVKNADGTISTVRSMSIGTDKGETLIPTVSEDGRIMSNDEAIAQFKQTGNNLGTFANVDAATTYAKQLSKNQDAQYSGTPKDQTKRPVGFFEAAGRGIVGELAKSNELITQGLGVFPYLEDKTLKAFGIDSDIYNRYISAVRSTGFGKPTEDAMAIQPTEELTTGGKIGMGVGGMAASLPYMMMSGGIGAEEAAAAEALQTIEPLMPRITQGIQAMLPMATEAGSDAVIQSAQQGDSPMVQVAKGMAQATATAAVGTVPLAMRSKISNGLLRTLEQGAYGYITGIPVAESQKVVSSWINGQPYIPSEFKEMAIQAVPMALMTGAFGYLHAPSKAPKLKPSENSEVNKKEAEILASADAQYAPPLETAVEVTTQKAAIPSAEVRATAPDLNSLISEQLFLDEGSPEYAAIQKQIDALSKPTGETTTSAAKPTEVTPVKEPTPTLPATGGELTANVVKGGTSLTVFSDNTLAELAEYYGVDVPKDASRGEIIDAINAKRTAEAPVEQVEAPKEEAAPKKLENPYKDIERRYVNPDADAFKSTEELVIAVEEIANTENNKFLKDAITKYREVMDLGEDPAVLVDNLMAEVEREGNYREQGVKPSERGLPKADKKGREGYFISSDPVIKYLNDNRIRSRTEQSKYAKSRGEKLGGEYDDVPKLPPYHAASIYGGEQTIDQAHKALVDSGDMPVDSKPRDLWDKIAEASRSAINAEKAETERDSYEKEQTKKSKELEKLRKTNPEAYKAQEEKDLQAHFNRMRRREGGFLEFPQPIQEAAIRFGETVRKAGMEFREWAKEMTSRLGEGVKGYLRQIWNAVRESWNKDIGGGFDTGGRSLEMAAEEAKFAPKAPTEQEAFAKKAADAFQRGRGTPITEEEMGNILARKFPGISPSEASDLYATASGRPKTPAPYAGQAVAQETPEQISIRRKDQEDQVRRGILTATVPAGEGMSQVEITERGKQNLAQGVDPLQALEQAKTGNLESLITARAYYEGLQKQKSEILRKFGPNSPEYKRVSDEAQTYYEGLREAGTAASTALSTFKGQNDLSDAADIATAYRSITGEEPTLAKHEQIRKVADKVDRTIKESDKASEDHKVAMDEGLVEVDVQAPTSVEEGRQQVADLSDAQGKKAKDEIDRLNNELEQTKNDLEEVRQAKATGQDAESLKAYYEAKLKDLQGQLETQPKFGKEVLDQAQKLVDKWKADRLEAEKLLTKQLAQMGSFPDVSIVATIARIMRGHISELGLDFARSSKMILEKFGPKAEKYLKEAWAKADALIKGEDGGEKAVKTVRKAKAKPVSKMTPEEKAAESLRKRIAQAEKKIDDLNSGKITTPKEVEKVTNDEIKRLEDEYSQKKKELADARLKAKQKELFEQGKVGDDLNPEQVKTLWESAKRFYLDKGESDYDKMISDLASDFGLTPQQVRKAFGTPKGAKRASDEMYLKQRNRQMALDEAKRWLDNQKASWIGRVFGAAAEKTFKLAIFGHGTAFIGTHAPSTLYTNPKLALKAWLKGLSYSFTGKDGRIQNIVDNKDLINRPSWIVARKGGLENDPREIRREGATPTRSDSALAKALDTISGGRGFDALFHLRQDMFDQAWQQLSVTQRTPEMAEMYANAINNATGFTKGGKGSAGILQSPITKILFFAPKLIASRFKWLIQDPARMLGTFGKMANPFLKVSPEERMSAIYEAKNKAKFLGVMTGTLLANQALLSITGSNQSVNFLDPKKRDWLAYKGFGYELATIGAFTRIFRLVAQEYNAVFGELSRWQKAKGGREQAMKDAVYTYLRSGFSPITRDIIVASTGKDYVGNTVPWSKEQPDRGRRKLTWRELIQEQFAPIPISEAATQKEVLPAVVKAGSAAFLGTRADTPRDIEEYEKSLKSKSSSKSSKPFYQKSSQSKKSKPFYAK